jgi:hypothetical protein
MALPDFLIVGAMKCGTSTLAAQLGAQPGLFMTTPKEPNFFSDDEVHARGMAWYEALFDAAPPGALKGEASTHYTKRPTHPDTLARLTTALPSAPRIIYLIRDPVERTLSHYLHERTMGKIATNIESAFDRHPEMVAYSCYGQQIAPYVQAFGAERIHVTSLERMERQPQDVLDEVCAFLGYPGAPVWQEERARVNASTERIRLLPMHKLLVDNPVATALRRALVPQALRQRIKQSRQIQDRPQLSPARRRALEEVFARDHGELRRMFPDAAHLDASYPFLAAS